MNTYDTEKALVGVPLRVTNPQRIGNCKMKMGDTLTVTDWGSGPFANYVEFTNNRLPHYTFKTATYVFKRMTKGE